jgi:hypothetical protein
MATSEEKQQLVEELKGPHFYRVMIWGYGGESSYMRIPKEAHDYWNKVTDECGDGPLVRYIVSADECTADEVETSDTFEDYEDEMEEFMPVPDEAKFMHDVNDKESVGYTWYEPKDEIEHVWGVASDNARITVEKIDSDEYNADHIEDIIDGEELYELINRLDEEVDYEVEHTDGSENIKYPKKGDFVCHMYSSEKGTFFEGRIETAALFDPQKLKFVIDEAPNGEDTVFSVFYDGEEVDNEGGDTNGKGYYASVWKQEY